jgi:NAD(P)-dependent dehydrogenase (short-subunit alcohol dehydrogenase family)
MGLLDGKVAIVSGAGHGIGRGEAMELAANGAKVVVNDLGTSSKGEGSDTTAADETVKLITDAGGEAVANGGNVASWADTEAMIHQAIDAFGGLDIVVNNAGILRDVSIAKMTENDWDLVLGVHLKGTFNLTHHAMVYWQNESKEGRRRNAAIINTVSSAGLQGNAGQANYGAAKGGIAALTMITALEGKRSGVRANAIAPGGATRIVHETMPQIPLVEANEVEEGVFERLNPGNSAPIVAWLASDEALHVTGQVFRAVGDEIAHYLPWKIGPMVKAGREPQRWDATKIGDAVNAGIFGSGIGGLQMGAG